MQSHICKVYTCLAVTCNLHFWQNDLGLLCATAVTQGWNGYQNKSQHRKLTLEKKIHPPLLQGFEPTTFWSWIRYSNQWAIPAPNFWIRQQFDCWPPRLSEFPLLNQFLYMYRLLTNTAKHGQVVWSVRFHWKERERGKRKKTENQRDEILWNFWCLAFLGLTSVVTMPLPLH